MRIELVPQVRDDKLFVVKLGNQLTINGETADFSPMTEGATLPNTAISSSWFASDVHMKDGEIILSLFLPNGVTASPEQLFPSALVDVSDGPVELPRPLPEPGLEQEVTLKGAQ